MNTIDKELQRLIDGAELINDIDADDSCMMVPVSDIEALKQKLEGEKQQMPEHDKIYERYEDMSVRGKLCLMRQPDGDACITAVCGDSVDDFQMVNLEFCTSGGKSPNTRQALYDLMLAIEKDNNENPDHRMFNTPTK